jgi:ribonuclease P protein component
MAFGCACVPEPGAPFFPDAGRRAVRRCPPDASERGSVVLPAASRLRRRPEFTTVVRHGRRGACPSLVVHLDVDHEQLSLTSPSPRVGFVVSRAVGDAVTRNRVRRRLRHLMASRLAGLPAGARVVIRVLPAAVNLSGSALTIDLDAALSRALRPRRASTLGHGGGVR